MTERKNPDFSTTAVNLQNPPQVKALLDKLHKAKADLSFQESTIPFAIRKAIEVDGKVIIDTTAAIKEAIAEFGSYQDVEAGVYGVCYESPVQHFHAEALKEHFPKLVPLVIKEVLDKVELQKLIRGKTVSEDELKDHGVITLTDGFAHWIR